MELTDSLQELLEWMHRWENRLSKMAGLTAAQGRVISLVGRMEGVKMGEVALRLALSTGTVTLMVDHLERADLVERRPCTTDRRSLELYLTDRGHRAYRIIRTGQESMTRRMLESQSQTLRELFIHWLKDSFSD